ncbi:MAG: AAA family ATPase [Gemmataceae bacterium]|nr:AAA family ATPase [Gemmataceae bacterium]
MNPLVLDPRPLDQLLPDPTAPAAVTEWVWDGYLARGNLTLLTSRWKAGKTTLVAGLLRALGAGNPFLGRPCTAGHAVVVSEESADHWAARGRAIPPGPHARLVSRPLPGRPSPDRWDELVRGVEGLRAAGPLDLVVVDTLAEFLPGRSDGDPGTLLDFLRPLRRLAGGGTAVLILHHPRKRPAEEGSTARGSGALLGYVDVVLELHRYGTLAADGNRRRLVGRSRHPETPAAVVYEWTPGTPDFRAVADPLAERFREHWAAVGRLLAGRRKAATHKELLADWPADEVPPSPAQLYEWLARAAGEKRVVRSGSGTRRDPFRFALPPDPRDRLPDLPPLR